MSATEEDALMGVGELKRIIEAALLSVGRPLKMEQIEKLFAEQRSRPTRDQIREAIGRIQEDSQGRGYELREVASGFRFQVREEFAQWVALLWEEKPPRYSRALLETLALIAYRQPITRAEIEEIRGVSVSTHIVKTLMERDWIRVVGHREVPGRPAMFGTTRHFLDYFNLASLDELPSLMELKNFETMTPELDFGPLPGGTDQTGDEFNTTPGEEARTEQLEDNVTELRPRLGERN